MNLLRNEPSVTIEEFEKLVLRIEGICMRLRAPIGYKLPAYPFGRAANSCWTLKEFYEKRIRPYVFDIEVSFISPKGKELRKNTKLSTAKQQTK